MKVLAWIAPGTWESVVEAAARRPQDDEITLVVAVDDAEALPAGLLGSLMGRGWEAQRHRAEFSSLSERTGQELLEQAAARLGRPCGTVLLTGPTERVVTAACEHADLLLLARDGDRSRLGPHSLGRHTRFVLDHAPCTVALLWPGEAPSLDSIPAPPAPGH